MKKKAVMLVMAGMLVTASVTGCSSFDGDAAAITVGDTTVTADEANFYARYTQAQYETYYGSYMGDNMWNTEAEEGKTYEEAVKSGVQDSLKNMVLLEQHMKDYDVSLTEADEKKIESAAKQFNDDNAQDGKEKVSGNEEAVERVLTLLSIQSKLAPKIDAEVDTNVSDKEAAQKKMQYIWFSYNKTDEEGNSTALSDEVKAELKKSAEAAAKEIKEGKDLAKVAKKYHAKEDSATFDAKGVNPNADVVKAADALKKGGVTDVIETDMGCYVAKVVSMMDKDATESKKAEILEQRKSDHFEEVCKGWEKDTKVKVNDKVWDKIDFNELRVTMKVEQKEPYTDSVQTDDQAEASE